MSEKQEFNEEFFSHDPLNPIEEILAPVAGFGVTFKSMFDGYVTEQYPFQKVPTQERYHGRHQLNRYEDGLEKCVGCELCAMSCPADAIYVEGAENTEENRFSPGERYGKVWQVNYLRCIFCGMCVEACPTRALTMNNDFEIADDTREKLVYEKKDVLVALKEGMLQTPHPMPENTTERDYYLDKIHGVTADQVEWVKQHRKDDETISTAKIVDTPLEEN